MEMDLIMEEVDEILRREREAGAGEIEAVRLLKILATLLSWTRVDFDFLDGVGHIVLQDLKDFAYAFERTDLALSLSCATALEIAQELVLDVVTFIKKYTGVQNLRAFLNRWQQDPFWKDGSTQAIREFVSASLASPA